MCVHGPATVECSASLIHLLIIESYLFALAASLSFLWVHGFYIYIFLMYYYANLVCTIFQASQQSFANVVLVAPSHYIVIIRNVSRVDTSSVFVLFPRKVVLFFKELESSPLCVFCLHIS